MPTASKNSENRGFVISVEKYDGSESNPAIGPEGPEASFSAVLKDPETKKATLRRSDSDARVSVTYYPGMGDGRFASCFSAFATGIGGISASKRLDSPASVAEFAVGYLSGKIPI